MSNKKNNLNEGVSFEHIDNSAVSKGISKSFADLIALYVNDLVLENKLSEQGDLFKSILIKPTQQEKIMALNSGFSEKAVANSYIASPALTGYGAGISKQVMESVVSSIIFQTYLSGREGESSIRFLYEDTGGENNIAAPSDASSSPGQEDAPLLNLLIRSDNYSVKNFILEANITSSELMEFAALMSKMSGPSGFGIMELKSQRLLEGIMKGIDNLVFATMRSKRATGDASPIKITSDDAFSIGNGADRGTKTVQFILELANELFQSSGTVLPRVIVVPFDFASLLGEPYALGGTNAAVSALKWIEDTFPGLYGVKPRFVFTSHMVEGSDKGVYVLDNSPEYCGQGYNAYPIIEPPFNRFRDVKIRGVARHVGFVPRINSCGVYRKYTT